MSAALCMNGVCERLEAVGMRFIVTELLRGWRRASSRVSMRLRSSEKRMLGWRMAFDELARVRGLSDEELLVGLAGLLGTGRRLMAGVIAHLGEVEERRLDLIAGYGSMFAYCTSRLRMSEDEACRRIEVARLARRFPLLFERLASGRISLSVAALLKSCLTNENLEGLVDAVSDKTVQQAREVLVGWFPKPDVAPSIRKLPERRVRGASASAGDDAGHDARSDAIRAVNHAAIQGGAAAGKMVAGCTEALPARQTCAQREHVAAASLAVVQGSSATSTPVGSQPGGEAAPRLEKDGSTPVPWFRPSAVPRSVEPLSPGRYKMQLTVSS